MTIFIPLLIAIIGAFVYAVSANPKVQELGRLAFLCGLFVTLFQLGGTASILR